MPFLCFLCVALWLASDQTEYGAGCALPIDARSVTRQSPGERSEKIQLDLVELGRLLQKRMMGYPWHDHGLRSRNLGCQELQRIWPVPLSKDDERQHANLEE